MRHVLAFLLLALLPPGAAAASVPIEPGVLVPFAEGDELAWEGIPAEVRWLNLRAGPEDVRVRWREPAEHGLPAGTGLTDPDGEPVHWDGAVRDVGPRSGFGARIELKEGERLVLDVEKGSGWVLLSRRGLAESSDGNGTHAFLRHAGRLAPGACEAESFSAADLGNVRQGTGVLRGPAVVEAGGPGITFRLLDVEGRTLAEAPDVLSARLDHDALEAFESHTLHLQACAARHAPEEGVPFVVRVMRTAEPDATLRASPIPLGLVAVLAAPLAAALARRRAR